MTGPDRRAVAIVLAAGRATRFGATKQLAERDQLPLVAHAVRCAHAAGCDQVLVVVGHEADRVAAAAAAGGPVEVVHNPRYADGQSTSLAAGVAAAEPSDVRVAVVLLADQPGVDPDVVRRVVAATDGDVDAARARYDDGAGHPVAFVRTVWPQLLQVVGDRGARALLQRLRVAEVPVTGPAPPDVDTPADLVG